MRLKHPDYYCVWRQLYTYYVRATWTCTCHVRNKAPGYSEAITALRWLYFRQYRAELLLWLRRWTSYLNIKNRGGRSRCMLGCLSRDWQRVVHPGAKRRCGDWLAIDLRGHQGMHAMLRVQKLSYFKCHSISCGWAVNQYCVVKPVSTTIITSNYPCAEQ